MSADIVNYPRSSYTVISLETMQMVATIIGILFGLFVVAGAYGLAYILMARRAKDMRAVAARWGFQYLGPSASRWRSPSSRDLSSTTLPASFPKTCHPVLPFKQVWNVIEGQRSGVSILIFDSIIGLRRGTGRYCTFIAINTESNVFSTDICSEKFVHSRGWTGVYRLRLLQVPWTISIHRIEQHLGDLRL